ncbi:choline/carnitine/betaine transporter [Desulfonatronospira thiodismutans ASO3-1]|uniref:Choline/carnitine/betaine transporter n=1 Tax=Desulfonatronospira thiodismutans ASO3-1 TaxID=555779 RepID=D6SQ31_9BACT|nr:MULTISPECIES: choline BCCT transporter BetT [Desulfonatronospira]EFI34857.1 choline/carnitine/betaine transporter [Desulfonatronospira thiodismutans ASO3-1]RQD77670.1 MAG: BCCT family transporter [Desulfonatronospira sp. MSAO_Bac3]
MEENTSPLSTEKSWIKINPAVFFSSALLTIIFVVLTISSPERAGEIFGSVQGWIAESVGWFYILSVATFLVFVIFLGVSSLGTIKLGPDHSEPDYTYISWFAMLFSAGMGIGLMFFGVAEPVMHYLSPPVGEGGTPEAARESMKITFFHWGLHAWAIYAVVAISLAYFAFRHNLPLTIRSAFYPLIGERIYGPIGHAVDTFAVLGTMFGVATSLGLGVTQINAGLEYLFGVPIDIWVQILLIAVITVIATISVVMGLDGGIKRISELNMILAVGLVIFVLIFGPTVFLMQTFTQNTGAYIADLAEMTFNLHAYDPTDWIGGWTLFYWGWWIAWSPFVGMFIARVSRGRTIRQFVVGVLMVPVGFTFIWMTFFGNTALHMIMIQGMTHLGDAVSEDATVALFRFFEHLPLSTIISFIATILVVTFFVTSSDSGSLVIDMLTSGGEENAPVWQRIFWATSEGVVAAVLLVAGGLGALQTASIASALPFTAIMLLMCLGLYKSVRMEVVKKVTLKHATTMPYSSQPGSWKKRLKTLVYQPTKKEVLNFIQQTVWPAMEEVAQEMEMRGIQTSIQEGEDGRVWLEVLHGEEIDFFYSVRPREYEPPAFTLRATSVNRPGQERKYYRAEVHLREGGQDYDIMNWTKDQIITDILDHYEKHLQFLDVVR